MSANQIKFTKRKLESLQAPSVGSDTYHDTQTQGLKLRISKTGTMTFFVYRKIKGRPERITLGRFPQITVDHARTKTHQINASVADGMNPNQVKRQERQEPTLQNLYSRYMQDHAKVFKKRWDEDEERYNLHLKRWENRKLSGITKEDCITLHKKIGKLSGPYAANRAIQVLQGMYSKGQDWDMFKGDNPAKAVRRFKELKRERFIESHEMAAFFEAVSEETNETIKDYVLLSLLTGARQDNVLTMRWDEIEFNSRTWRISHTKTKGGEALTVPLVDAAIEILRTRQIASSSDYVLEGKGKAGHLVNPSKGWNRILDRANLTNLRLHDIRRTMGSWQAKTGASLPIIGKSLGHKNINTTMIYARLDSDPVRESMERAIGAMKDAANDRSDENVIPLKVSKQ